MAKPLFASRTKVFTRIVVTTIRGRRFKVVRLSFSITSKLTGLEIAINIAAALVRWLRAVPTFS
jgi:hypothetical protein